MSSKHQAFYIILPGAPGGAFAVAAAAAAAGFSMIFCLEHLRLVVRIKLLELQAGRVTRKIGRRESPDHLLTKAGFATQEVGHIMS